MELDLPLPYVARPYRGRVDHPVLAGVLREYHEHIGNPELPTAEDLDVTYANLVNCDLDNDAAIIEDGDGEPAGYVRVNWEELEDGSRDYITFSPLRPAHLQRPLYLAALAGQEAHMLPWTAGHSARFVAYAIHPGPNLPPTGEAAWLESAGYGPVRFGAYLVRPDLDAIPERTLPDGVELRPVTEDQVRTIWEAHWEAFRGSFGFRESTEEDFNEFRDSPTRDISLWKIAWAGDTVVGQVKSFVNEDENRRHGYRRGWTEEISTHADWRNRGIAGALLAMSLQELRDRGFEQAALGVDTQNPGGAFHLYTDLGFELQSYEATYAKPV
jgi:ribosomal protein S18 acetylase RimI-like enzyme